MKNNIKSVTKSPRWKDTGLPEDLLVANKLLLDQMEESHFPNHGAIDSTAGITGKVRIGIGSRVGRMQNYRPVIVAENCIWKTAKSTM